MAFDDDGPVPLNVPGLPEVMPRGPGSRDGWHYTPALGEAIAELYSDGTDLDAPKGMSGGLWGLHYALPHRIPPPAIVRAWCKQWPAFGLLMREAERLRAERLMEETIVIADTDPAAPPRVALRIAVRQEMAGKLDAARYGKQAGMPSLGAPAAGDVQPVALDVDDATLAALALAGVAEREGVARGG